MKLLKIWKRAEGEIIAQAWVNLCSTHTRYSRNYVLAVVFPIPFFYEYEDFNSCAQRKGWRVPVLSIRWHRERVKWLPVISFNCYLKCLGKQEIVSTYEQQQDKYGIHTTEKIQRRGRR